jgi:drug/metabolite transporter (DMT)-like permease
MRRFSPDQIGIALAILAAVLFGVFPAGVRAVYADGGNVVFVMIATIWSRATGLTLYCLIKRKPMFNTAEDRRQALIGGVCQAFSSSATMTALTFMSGPLVIMVLFTHTLMLLMLLVWKGDIKFDASILGTTVAALIGLSIVLDIWHTQPPNNLWGIGCAFAAAMAIVVRMYVYGRQTRERNPAVVGAENFLVAAILTLVVLFFKAPQLPHSPESYAWLGVLGHGLGNVYDVFWYINDWFIRLEPVFKTGAYFCGYILSRTDP